MHFLTLSPLLLALPVLSTLIFTDFPHLLISLDKNQPDTVIGTLPSATVSNSIWTEVSFDVHQYKDYPANICRLNFHVNTNGPKNAPRKLDGEAPYKFEIYRLEPTIDKNADTWDSHPPMSEKWAMATVTLTKEWGVTVEGGWFTCPFGNVAQFILKPVDDRAFSYSWYELNYGENEGGPHGLTLEMHS